MSSQGAGAGGFTRGSRCTGSCVPGGHQEGQGPALRWRGPGGRSQEGEESGSGVAVCADTSRDAVTALGDTELRKTFSVPRPRAVDGGRPPGPPALPGRVRLAWAARKRGRGCDRCPSFPSSCRSAEPGLGARRPHAPRHPWAPVRHPHRPPAASHAGPGRALPGPGGHAAQVRPASGFRTRTRPGAGLTARAGLMVGRGGARRGRGWRRSENTHPVSSLRASGSAGLSTGTLRPHSALSDGHEWTCPSSALLLGRNPQSDDKCPRPGSTFLSLGHTGKRTKNFTSRPCDTQLLALHWPLVTDCPLSPPTCFQRPRHRPRGRLGLLAGRAGRPGGGWAVLSPRAVLGRRAGAQAPGGPRVAGLRAPASSPRQGHPFLRHLLPAVRQPEPARGGRAHGEGALRALLRRGLCRWLCGRRRRDAAGR